MASSICVVHKERYNEQHFCPAQTPGELGRSSIRIRTISIGLSSNNLSYCLAGSLLHWWDCYPTPSYVPNAAEHGIAPAWGYARVEQSNIASLPVGRMIYGFIPISQHSVDLQLQQSVQLPTHYIENSPHRSQVMAMYQRYQLEPEGIDLTSQLMQWNLVLKTWESGHVLSDECFPSDGRFPVHPLGVPVSPWTEKEANLDDACIVCLAAGTKTSRSFLYSLAASHATQKCSVVEVTTNAEGCRQFLKQVPFNHTVAHYNDITTALKSSSKYVILDFGGRDFALEKAAKAAKKVNAQAELICVLIGGESKVYDAEAAQKRRQIAAELNCVQMNATGIRDAVMKRDGEAKYFADLDESFEKMVSEQVANCNGKVLGVTINTYQGLRGDDGVEGLWQKFCSGQISGDHGVVVSLG